MAGFGDFVSGLGGAASQFATGVGQVLTGNFGGAWNTASTNPYSAPKTTNTGGGYIPKVADTSIPIATSWNGSESAALLAELSRLQSQIAQQPRLPFFDSSANYARSQAKAGSVVNPVYQDKLTKFLESQQLKRTAKETEINRGKEDFDTALQQALQDSSLDRTRTAEDTAGKIADINYNADQFQTQEGRDFDKSNRAMRSDVFNAGLIGSGQGEQALQEAVKIRNENSNDQVRTFEKQKQVAQTLQDRHFEDLDVSDTRKQEATTLGKQRLDVDMDQYIDSLNNEEGQFRASNEAERLSALYQETQNQARIGVNDFIQGLINSGARAQDIATAQQVYGR